MQNQRQAYWEAVSAWLQRRRADTGWREGWSKQVLSCCIYWVGSPIFFTLKHVCCSKNAEATPQPHTPGFDLLKRVLGLILGSPGSVWGEPGQSSLLPQLLRDEICFHNGVSSTLVHRFAQWHHKTAERTDDGAGGFPVMDWWAVQCPGLSLSDCWVFRTPKTLIQLPVNRRWMDGKYFLGSIKVDSSISLMNEKRRP